MIHIKPIIQNFNSSFIELINITPENVLTRETKNKFTSAIKANSLLLIEEFIINVMIHRKEISERNEEYFVNYNFNIDDKTYINDKKSVIDMIISMKNTLKIISDEEKEKYWNYINYLIEIADEYIEKKYNK